MKEPLKPGIEYTHTFVVPPNKTVPALYPEAEEFLAMPEVFATGFLVGFIEWTCLKALNPYLDWPKEQSVGTRIHISHTAATPPGLAVTAKVKLIEVEGRRVLFEGIATLQRVRYGKWASISQSILLIIGGFYERNRFE